MKTKARTRERRATSRLRDAGRALARWYAAHGRDLPWRRSRDPYRVLVSEVMLQQTTVETAIPYYERFIAAYPDVEALAAASEEDLLRTWSGLGYYRRARSLKEAARAIVRDHGGRVPDRMDSLRRLPGIGPYTASAILAIAFGRPEVALDGNLRRVLARLIAHRGDPRSMAGESALSEAGRRLVGSGDPSVLNQALMDLGATICAPRAPRCDECPVERWCEGRRLGIEARIPPPRKRKEPVTVALAAGVIRRGARVLMVARGGDLMRGLWEFPMVEVGEGERKGDSPQASLVELLRQAHEVRVGSLCLVGVIRHSITHHRFRVVIFEGRAPSRAGAARGRRPFERGRVAEGMTREGRIGRSSRRGTFGGQAGAAVCRVAEGDPEAIRWVPADAIADLPLTGIARKIVRAVGAAAAISRPGSGKP